MVVIRVRHLLESGVYVRPDAYLCVYCIRQRYLFSWGWSKIKDFKIGKAIDYFVLILLITKTLGPTFSWNIHMPPKILNACKMPSREFGSISMPPEIFWIKCLFQTYFIFKSPERNGEKIGNGLFLYPLKT